MTYTITIAWLIWITKTCVIWMSYMTCKSLKISQDWYHEIYIENLYLLCDMNVLYDLQILENITSLISWNLYWKSLSSVVAKFILKFILFNEDNDKVLRLELIGLCLNPMGWNSSVFYLLIIWHIDRGSYV